MAISFNAKHISDPVHGSIGLSKTELLIISTKSFQRLRNIKHLGLVDYVFPGATYARFSHCLGACHLTGRIFDSIRQNRRNIEDEDVQRYRMAALLHDIGHYPFSHVMEPPVENFYKAPLMKPKSEEQPIIARGEEPGAHPPFFKHESLGKEIVIRDPELTQILENNGFEPRDIASIFMREKPDIFTNLISSDLDADRIDYLLRTAHHTGLPYGSVDLDYILSQMRVDEEDNLCLTRKALRAADHFLLCRYFDYQQVSFHKTVAAFELVLADVIRELIERKLVDCSGAYISEQIQRGTWCHFDDAHILQCIKNLCSDSKRDDICRTKAIAILDRKPPKLVKEVSELDVRDNSRKERHDNLTGFLKQRIPGWAEKLGIDHHLWYLWDKSPALTKIGLHVDSSSIISQDSKEQEDLRQAIRVLDPSTGRSRSIMEMGDSLMKILSDQRLYVIRLYVLLPPGMEGYESKIRDFIDREWPPS